MDIRLGFASDYHYRPCCCWFGTSFLTSLWIWGMGFRSSISQFRVYRQFLFWPVIREPVQSLLFLLCPGYAFLRRPLGTGNLCFLLPWCFSSQSRINHFPCSLRPPPGLIHGVDKCTTHVSSAISSKGSLTRHEPPYREAGWWHNWPITTIRTGQTGPPPLLTRQGWDSRGRNRLVDWLGHNWQSVIQR